MKTKRKPYLRSVFFDKEKIFLELFWRHMHEKNWRDRARRLRFFAAAIELMQNSRFAPEIKQNANKSSELLYRFEGITADGHHFAVQIKLNKKSKQKFFYSVFPRP